MCELLFLTYMACIVQCTQMLVVHVKSNPASAIENREYCTCVGVRIYGIPMHCTYGSMFVRAGNIYTLHAVVDVIMKFSQLKLN
jgi:hypothetical protein